jgi:hypothetical protein
MWQRLKESKLISYLSLFSSFGTLICCAIPSTFVLLGFGSTLATFLGDFPGLIWLSEYKEFVFGFSFLFLGGSYISMRTSESMVCPIEKKEDCEATKNWTKPLFFISLGINVIGALYAFIMPLF